MRRIREEKKYAKAVKADDAEVTVHLWNERVTIPGFSRQRKDEFLDTLRICAHKYFLENLRRDCRNHMESEIGWIVRLLGSEAGLRCNSGDPLAFRPHKLV